MKTVITYGTFDLFHIGHVRLLKRAKELAKGGKLKVFVSTDEFNHAKQKQSIIPYEQRVEVVKACKYVDEVHPERRWFQKKSDIIKHHADIFVMGDDWEGKFDDLDCEVVYLSRTEDISTTDIKKTLKEVL